MSGIKASQEKIIERCVKMHGDLYDYSRVKYLGAHVEIEIGCKIHEWFWQNPRVHYRGSHCPKCARKNRKPKSRYTQGKVIRKCISIHGNTYDYSKSVYTKMHIPMEIICRVHGSFWQKPSDHIRKHGCHKCGKIKKANSHRNKLNEMIEKWNIIHEGKFDYSKVVYTGQKDEIEIICPILNHGSFWQKPDAHRKGHGCPKCYTKVSKKEIDWLDSLGLLNDNEHRQVHIKIGRKWITTDGFDQNTNTIYEFLGDFWHGNPNVYNHTDLNKVAKKTYGELYNLTISRFDMLKKAGYNIMFIWEMDWDQMHNEIKRSA
jgi:protein-arginine kinase activator protein McsA